MRRSHLGLESPVCLISPLILRCSLCLFFVSVLRASVANSDPWMRVFLTAFRPICLNGVRRTACGISRIQTANATQVAGELCPASSL